MSRSLKPLALTLLLVRHSRQLTSNWVRPIHQVVKSQFTWCRVRASSRRLAHTSSVALQQQETGGTANKGLTLTESCVKVPTQVLLIQLPY